jgi:hypothetical protein
VSRLLKDKGSPPQPFYKEDICGNVFVAGLTVLGLIISAKDVAENSQELHKRKDKRKCYWLYSLVL